MHQRARRWLGGLATLTVGMLGATIILKNKRANRTSAAAGRQRDVVALNVADVWARPGMNVTFRAEVMPGRERAARTFRVASLLNQQRVRLEGVAGEHTENEFEPLRRDR